MAPPPAPINDRIAGGRTVDEAQVENCIYGHHWRIVGDEDNNLKDPAVDWIENDFQLQTTTSRGIRFLDLTGYKDTPGKQGLFSGVTQTIDTDAGSWYTLSLKLGTKDDNPIFAGPIAVRVSLKQSVEQGPEKPEFQVETLEKGAAPPSAGNNWIERHFDFQAQSSKTKILIRGSKGAHYIGLDNVVVMPRFWYVVVTTVRVFMLAALSLVGLVRGHRPTDHR